MGFAIGALLAYRTPMTGMPQMVGLLNGFGGLASLLVAAAEYNVTTAPSIFHSFIIVLTAFIGAVTFSGSVIAWAKLEERFISGKAVVFKGQQLVNIGILAAILLGSFLSFAGAADTEMGMSLFIGVALLSLLMGILLVIPIGGADMPVVICLLNSYSGMAACASGFLINNSLLIVGTSRCKRYHSYAYYVPGNEPLGCQRIFGRFWVGRIG